MASKKFGIVKAPDGFYIGSLLKTGMLSADSRKITDDEITFMFEDMMRRHKAETGKNVKMFFHAHQPALIAKVDPSLMECGIITPQVKAALEARERQKAAIIAQAKQRGLRINIPTPQ